MRKALWVALFASGACAHGGPAAPPSWYLPGAGAYAASEYAVGRGACGAEVAPARRAQCATQHAVDDALLQLRAHVRTTQEQSCRLVSRREHDQARAWSEATCASTLASHSESSLQVSNVAPREHTCADDTCYALVALSRSALSAEVERAHAAERADFEGLLARASGTDLLGTLSTLAQADLLAPRLDEAALLAAVYRGSASAQPGYAERVTRARHALLARASVCLRAAAGEPGAERVFAATSAMLSQRGVDRVQLSQACPRDTLIVEYVPSADATTAQPSDVSSSLYRMRYAGLIRVSAPDGRQVRELEVQGHGLSRSADSARRDAQDRLGAAVRSAVANLVLGVSG